MSQELTYEQALEKLDEKLKLLEDGELSLEDALKAVDEARIYLKVCTDRLEVARRKIEFAGKVLLGSLADQTRKYSYHLAIKEIIVSGDMAAVRLTWTLTVKRPGQVGGTSTNEPGLDIFRRQGDGSWKIIRYIAYEE